MQFGKKYDKKNITLQSQLYIAYLGMFLAALIVFAVFFYVFFSQKLINESNENLLQSLANGQESTESQIGNMNTISVNINYSSILSARTAFSGNDFDLSQSGDLYKNLADLFILMNGTEIRADYIYLYDWNGNQLQVAANKRLARVDVTKQPWYQDTMAEDGSAFVSTPYKKTVGNYTSEVISLYRTYVNSGRQKAGIVETVKQCSSIFNDLSIEESSKTQPVRFYIYNDRGELIYPYQGNPADPDYPSLMQRQKHEEDAIVRVKNPISHESEYVTAGSSGLDGWTYYAVQDKDTVLAPLHQMVRTMVIFFAVLIIIAAFPASALSRRLARPLTHLKHLIQHMNFSNLGAEPADAGSLMLNSETRELYDSFEKMNNKLKASKDQLVKAHEGELEARSLALQSQMSPHFYYNSLACIMALAENDDPDGVTDMCRNLSCIMRYVTDFKTKTVTIAMELDYICEYLSCMKARNPSSLNFTVDVPPELMEIKIPKLSIHPLVENAVKYGTNCIPPWQITVTGQAEEDEWTITVSDEGPGFAEDAIARIDAKITELNTHRDELPQLSINGLGLANVYVRLLLSMKHRVIFRYGNTPQGHGYVTLGCCVKEENTWIIQ